MKSLLGAVCICALVAGAWADVELSIIEVDNTDVPAGDSYDGTFFGGTTHFTYDLVADVTGNDDWTIAWSEVYAQGATTFYEHPQEQPYQAPPAPDEGSLSYDTYYRSPGNPGAIPTYDYGPTAEWDHLDASWYDLAWMGDGSFTLMRFTMIVPAGTVPIINGPGEALATGYLEVNTDNWGGQIFGLDFTISTPEPSSLSLLALASLAALRRR